MQHEARRGDLMTHFGSFQTSLTLGRKALQVSISYHYKISFCKMYIIVDCKKSWVVYGLTIFSAGSKIFKYIALEILFVFRVAN